MKAVREQLKIDVQAAFDAGELKWENKHVLQESFDQHDPLREGEEMLPVKICGDDDAAHSGKGGSVPNGAAEENLDDCEEGSLSGASEVESVAEADLVAFLPEGEDASGIGEAGMVAAHQSSSSSSAASGSTSAAKSSACVSSPVVKKPPGESVSLQEKIDGLRQMAAIARATDQPSVAAFLDTRLATILRQEKSIDPKDRLLLKEEALKRKQELDDRRREIVEKEEAKKKADLEASTTISKNNTLAQEAKAQRAAVDLQLFQLKAAREKEIQESQQRAVSLRAGWAAGLAMELLIPPPPAESTEINKGIAQAIRMKLGAKSVVKPEFWKPDTREAVRLQCGVFGTNHVWASERFEWVLYGNRRQVDVAHDVCPVDRFRALLMKSLPRYREVCVRYSPETVLQTNGFNLDLAFLEAAWRYGHAVSPSVLGKRAFCKWPPDDSWGESFCGPPG